MQFVEVVSTTEIRILGVETQPLRTFVAAAGSPHRRYLARRLEMMSSPRSQDLKFAISRIASGGELFRI